MYVMMARVTLNVLFTNSSISYITSHRQPFVLLRLVVRRFRVVFDVLAVFVFLLGGCRLSSDLRFVSPGGAWDVNGFFLVFVGGGFSFGAVAIALMVMSRSEIEEVVLVDAGAGRAGAGLGFLVAVVEFVGRRVSHNAKSCLFASSSSAVAFASCRIGKLITHSHNNANAKALVPLLGNLRTDRRRSASSEPSLFAIVRESGRCCLSS